jgi:N-methylhydantoinase A
MKVVGVDVGGTFTDLVLYDAASGAVAVHKVASTPEDPSRAVISGLVDLCVKAGVEHAAVAHVFHGTTVATNAAIQHVGARTGMITTAGFRDILHIGRHQRPQHYSILQDIPWQCRPLVERRHRLVVAERVVPPGDILVPLDEEGVRKAARQLREDGVEAIAICFLFAHINPTHERRAKQIVLEECPRLFVSCSHEVSLQFREFERFTTTAMNVFVGPLVRDYVAKLEQDLKLAGFSAELRVMGSNGGMAAPAVVAERPVITLMSGLAAGVIGCAHVAEHAGRPNAISLDIGGTSADIGVITEGRFGEASSRDSQVASFPILVPMLDLHTIGAGGGSIARRDQGGAFRVGPQSAGAVPGPVAYRRGGEEPTVTDANVVLGRLDPGGRLAGGLTLDVAGATAAVQKLADELGLGLHEAAEGVVTILNANMANAIRSRTVQKGIDPRQYVLVVAGGAGPLHGAEVARELGMSEVIVPPYPGLTSAIGLLATDLKYDLVQSLLLPLAQVDVAKLGERQSAMRAELLASLAADGLGLNSIEIAYAFDMRYAGQGYELQVALPGTTGETPLLDADLIAAMASRFHEHHAAEYGLAFPLQAVELVNIRATGIGRISRIGAVTSFGSAAGAKCIPQRVATVLFRIGDHVGAFETPFYGRTDLQVDRVLQGPAIITQADTTIVVPPDCACRQLASGEMVIHVGQTAADAGMMFDASARHEGTNEGASRGTELAGQGA